MGSKNSKTKSETYDDTVTPATSEPNISKKEKKPKKEKRTKESKKAKKTEPENKNQSQVILPVNPDAVFANKEFLNDLSVFIMKAYDSQFRGSFNDYMVCLK